jgi:hypothetical protein
MVVQCSVINGNMQDDLPTDVCARFKPLILLLVCKSRRCFSQEAASDIGEAFD